MKGDRRILKGTLYREYNNSFNFWSWLIIAIICMMAQTISFIYPNLISINNLGILIALLFILAVLMDGFNQILKEMKR